MKLGIGASRETYMILEQESYDEEFFKMSGIRHIYLTYLWLLGYLEA